MFYFHSHHNHHSSSCSVKLTERSRSALIALMILLIENYHAKNKPKTRFEDNLQQQQQIIQNDLMQYLLAVFESLPNMKWIEDQFVPTTNYTASMASSKHSKLFLWFKIVLTFIANEFDLIVLKYTEEPVNFQSLFFKLKLLIRTKFVFKNNA